MLLSQNAQSIHTSAGKLVNSAHTHSTQIPEQMHSTSNIGSGWHIILVGPDCHVVLVGLDYYLVIAGSECHVVHLGPGGCHVVLLVLLGVVDVAQIAAWRLCVLSSLGHCDI